MEISGDVGLLSEITRRDTKEIENITNSYLDKYSKFTLQRLRSSNMKVDSIKSIVYVKSRLEKLQNSIAMLEQHKADLLNSSLINPVMNTVLIELNTKILTKYRAVDKLYSKLLWLGSKFRDDLTAVGEKKLAQYVLNFVIDFNGLSSEFIKNRVLSEFLVLKAKINKNGVNRERGVTCKDSSRSATSTRTASTNLAINYLISNNNTSSYPVNTNRYHTSRYRNNIPSTGFSFGVTEINKEQKNNHNETGSGSLTIPATILSRNTEKKLYTSIKRAEILLLSQVITNYAKLIIASSNLVNTEPFSTTTSFSIDSKPDISNPHHLSNKRPLQNNTKLVINPILKSIDSLIGVLENLESNKTTNYTAIRSTLYSIYEDLLIIENTISLGCGTGVTENNTVSRVVSKLYLILSQIYLKLNPQDRNTLG